MQYDNADKTSVTLNPGGAAATVHNVAAGVAPTDAADVGQVTDAVSTAESYTDASSASTLSAANTYTNAVAARLTSRIDQVATHANAATAAALASTDIPQAIKAGHAMVGFGVGTWAGETGFAAGLSTRLRDDHTTFKASVNFDSRGQGGGGAGVGYEFSDHRLGCTARRSAGVVVGGRLISGAARWTRKVRFPPESAHAGVPESGLRLGPL